MVSGLLAPRPITVTGAGLGRARPGGGRGNVPRCARAGPGAWVVLTPSRPSMVVAARSGDEPAQHRPIDAPCAAESRVLTA